MLKLCAAAVCTAALPIWIRYANVMETQLVAKCIANWVAADYHWWKFSANGHQLQLYLGLAWQHIDWQSRSAGVQARCMLNMGVDKCTVGANQVHEGTILKLACAK